MLVPYEYEFENIYIYWKENKKNEECFHPSADSRASHVANVEQPQWPTSKTPTKK